MLKYALNAKTNIEPKKTIEACYLQCTSLEIRTSCKTFYRISLETNLMPCFTNSNNGKIAGKIPSRFAQNNFAFFFIYLLRVFDTLLFCVVTRKEELL